MLLDADPPTHTWQRRLLQKAWTPRLIERLEGRIQRLLDDLLEPVLAAGRCDFHDVVAAPLPATMIAELVGVPIEDRDRFQGVVRRPGRGHWRNPGLRAGRGGRHPELEEYFRGHIAERRRSMVPAGRYLTTTRR